MKKLMVLPMLLLAAAAAKGDPIPGVRLQATASADTKYAGYTAYFAGWTGLSHMDYFADSPDWDGFYVGSGDLASISSMIGKDLQSSDLVSGFWYGLTVDYLGEGVELMPGWLNDETLGPAFRDPNQISDPESQIGFSPSEKVGADGSIKLGEINSGSGEWESGTAAYLAAILVSEDGSDIVYGAFELTDANWNDRQGVDGKWQFGPFIEATNGSPSPVPEPTSGLLLLLGVAGLALKRKRA